MVDGRALRLDVDGFGEAVSTQTETPASAWYLLQCKPRQDARAQEHLDRQGFECFAPTIAREALSGGRLKRVQQPLFPGYLFIRMGLADSWLALRSTRGVSRVVAFCGEPCRVRDPIVEHLKSRCADVPPERVLAPGDRVQIRLGEFADMEAIFVSMDGEERVMLLLSLLNREQQIQVGLASIRPAQGKAATFQ